MTICRCTLDDPALDDLRDLIASGVDQRTASLRLWAPHLVPGRVSVSERLRARLLAEAGAVTEAGITLACVAGLVLVLAWAVIGR